MCSNSFSKSSSAKKKPIQLHSRKKKSWRSLRGSLLIKRTVNSNFPKNYRHYLWIKLQKNANNNCLLYAQKPILQKYSWWSSLTVFTRKCRPALKRRLKSSKLGLQNQNLLLIQRWLLPQLLRALSSLVNHQVMQGREQYVCQLWISLRRSLLTK